ncbi:Yos1-like-domain-containing protein [Exophiala viscosa]|uniref:Yos1-like-domain-containing protein n=1 Tax=Exophiala viscosa TaxID=2486360 RepID=UPI0021938D3D|nr:Yos1-like-domain-containing protein [Exophiala viscosa]
MLSLFGFGPFIYGAQADTVTPTIKILTDNCLPASCLFLNAVAILSEDRFLARIGWGKSQLNDPAAGGAAFGTPGQDPESFRSKGINLISSIRTLCRVPLIFVNTVIIIYELMLG